MLMSILGRLLAMSLALAGAAWAERDPTQICDIVAGRISEETGVPVSVLQAITRTETGRQSGGKLRPWPWTVNMEGTGVWFDTEDEARSYVFHHFKKGARSFDVGCFQINYRWHGQHFNSIDEMFDPLINTRYAARFLADLYRELGDWTAAAGAYHSRTRKFADKYKARFSQIRESLPDKSIEPLRQSSTEIRVNTYSLFSGSGRISSPGSLVPLSNGGRSLFAPQVDG